MKDLKADLAAILVTLVCILLVLTVVKANAAPFTVDERSGLHFGVSGAIGFLGNSTLIGIQGEKMAYKDRWPRRAMIFAACNVPGLAKEFTMDAHADAGDLAFNVLGCAAGIAASDAAFMVVPMKNGIGIQGRFQ